VVSGSGAGVGLSSFVQLAMPNMSAAAANIAKIFFFIVIMF
jgi:hypothetical protein